MLRAYYDRNDVATGAIGATQENVGLFAGISQQNFSIGAEYMTLYNAKRVQGKHQYGYSVYSTVKLPNQFQDEYKFGSSADLGIAASYKISDLITIDATVINGEGYKKVNKDDALRYGG